MGPADVNTLREKTSAGPAEYTAAGQTWWSDVQLQAVLDRHVLAVDDAGVATRDVNAAAADVMEAWASAVKLDYDLSTDGQNLARSQRHDHLMAQARWFRSRSQPRSVPMVRTDETVPVPWGTVTA